jgi:cytochrome c oxidase assembly protein subunit 15
MAAAVKSSQGEDFDKLELDLQSKGEPFVMEGKEKIVGWWLIFFSASVALMIGVGGYTRLSKSGLSMVRWKPINYKLPHTLEEWSVEFDAYKVS